MIGSPNPFYTNSTLNIKSARDFRIVEALGRTLTVGSSRIERYAVGLGANVP